MPLPMPTSRADIAKLQSARKRIALERALKAPFHKDRLAGIDPEKLDDPVEWAKIPLLDKEELRAISPQAFIDDFCIGRRADIAEYWRSGGATGFPLFYPRSFEDMKYNLLSFRRTLEAIGATAGSGSGHVCAADSASNVAADAAAISVPGPAAGGAGVRLGRRRRNACAA